MWRKSASMSEHERIIEIILDEENCYLCCHQRASMIQLSLSNITLSIKFHLLNFGDDILKSLVQSQDNVLFSLILI